MVMAELSQRRQPRDQWVRLGFDVGSRRRPMGWLRTESVGVSGCRGSAHHSYSGYDLDSAPTDAAVLNHY